MSDDHLPLLVLFLDLQFFFSPDAGRFRLQSFFFLDSGRFCLFASGDGCNFTLLLLDGFDALLFEFQDCFLSFDVLLLQRLLFLTREVILLDLLRRSEFRNFLDTLRVQNVRRTETIEWRLLQIIDRTIVEHITIQIGADDSQDLLLELVAISVKLDEIEVLTNRLQRFRKLRFEQFFESDLL